jgi:hypothetical protein
MKIGEAVVPALWNVEVLGVSPLGAGPGDDVGVGVGEDGADGANDDEVVVMTTSGVREECSSMTKSGAPCSSSPTQFH